jgi:hypothetical protein
MQADVDMSGRIEETNRPTALAMANGVAVSIFMSAKDKRRIIEALRQRKPARERKFIHIRVFSTLLFLLLERDIEKLATVIVDPEYPGYEADIKDWGLTLCRRHGIPVHRDQIVFRRVGKKSPAHRLAYRTFRGKIQPTQRVAAEDVLRLTGK